MAERASKKVINQYPNVVWLFHMGHTGLVSLFGIFACFIAIVRMNLSVGLLSDFYFRMTERTAYLLSTYS